MRNFRVIFVLFFLLFFTQVLVAAKVVKEFTFILPPGEFSKVWEVHVPFPANETGKFIGRDFKPVVGDENTVLQIEKEALTGQQYYAKGKLFLINPPQTPAVTLAKLHLVLYTGKRVLNDVPAPPAMVEWLLGKTATLSWNGFGDVGLNHPISAKYLKYVVRKVSTAKTVVVQIVPVYLVGFKIPLSWQLPQNSDYIAEVRLSNTSAVFSKPTITNFFMLPMGKK